MSKYSWAYNNIKDNKNRSDAIEWLKKINNNSDISDILATISSFKFNQQSLDNLNAAHAHIMYHEDSDNDLMEQLALDTPIKDSPKTQEQINYNMVEQLLGRYIEDFERLLIDVYKDIINISRELYIDGVSFIWYIEYVQLL